jgi:hypothetical protein
MLNGHLSDEQVQELALNESSGTEAALHAANCPDCKTRVENYWLLMKAIEQEPAPAFSFDLAAAVVAQIETPPAKPKTSGLWWLFTITITTILVVTGIYFGGYMSELYQGIKSLSLYFIAITGIILGIVLAIAQYKTYQLKNKMLDLQ